MTTAGNHRDDENREPDTDAPLSEHIAAQDDGGTEVDADSIPVQGDDELADELAEEAYGDKDDDGNPDIPNAQFPA